MAAPSSSLSADTHGDEVKQPAVQPSPSDSVVFVNDMSRLRASDTSVVLSPATAVSDSAAAADGASVSVSVSGGGGGGGDPFGPLSDEWAAGSSSSSSSLASDDPFGSSSADGAYELTSSPNAFASFPKPGHVDDHQPAQADSSRRKSKKKKNKAALQPSSSEAAAVPAAGPTPDASVAAVSDGADGPQLLMADSLEYVAMLEQRLERLKKKQEARIKAASAKTTRRSTEFVSITTSGALNDTEDEKGQLGEHKADQQPPPQSAVVHSHTTAAPSATTNTANTASAAAHSLAAARHHTSVGLHSAPFDDDEVQSIMPTALPAAGIDGRGEAVEDEALMPSSDGEAVGVVADKTAYYENKNNLDEQNCAVM